MKILYLILFLASLSGVAFAAPAEITLKNGDILKVDSVLVQTPDLLVIKSNGEVKKINTVDLSNSSRKSFGLGELAEPAPASTPAPKPTAKPTSSPTSTQATPTPTPTPTSTPPSTPTPTPTPTPDSKPSPTPSSTILDSKTTGVEQPRHKSKLEGTEKKVKVEATQAQKPVLLEPTNVEVTLKNGRHISGEAIRLENNGVVIRHNAGMSYVKLADMDKESRAIIESISPKDPNIKLTTVDGKTFEGEPAIITNTMVLLRGKGGETYELDPRRLTKASQLVIFNGELPKSLTASATDQAPVAQPPQVVNEKPLAKAPVPKAEEVVAPAPKAEVVQTISISAPKAEIVSEPQATASVPVQKSAVLPDPTVVEGKWEDGDLDPFLSSPLEQEVIQKEKVKDTPLVESSTGMAQGSIQSTALAPLDNLPVIETEPPVQLELRDGTMVIAKKVVLTSPDLIILAMDNGNTERLDPAKLSRESLDQLGFSPEEIKEVLRRQEAKPTVLARPSNAVQSKPVAAAPSADTISSQATAASDALGLVLTLADGTKVKATKVLVQTKDMVIVSTGEGTKTFKASDLAEESQKALGFAVVKLPSKEEPRVVAQEGPSKPAQPLRAEVKIEPAPSTQEVGIEPEPFTELELLDGTKMMAKKVVLTSPALVILAMDNGNTERLDPAKLSRGSLDKLGFSPEEIKEVLRRQEAKPAVIASPSNAVQSKPVAAAPSADTVSSQATAASDASGLVLTLADGTKVKATKVLVQTKDVVIVSTGEGTKTFKAPDLAEESQKALGFAVVKPPSKEEPKLVPKAKDVKEEPMVVAKVVPPKSDQPLKAEPRATVAPEASTLVEEERGAKVVETPELEKPLPKGSIPKRYTCTPQQWDVITERILKNARLDYFPEGRKQAAVVMAPPEVHRQIIRFLWFSEISWQ
jgi:outer membrane biosynthesis protein TonB/DNA-binding transcriptional MerR regulator